MKHEPETTTDAGGSRAARAMTRTQRHPRRRLLAVGASAAVLLMGESRPAAAAGAEDCRENHQACTEARAAGYNAVGICHDEGPEGPADRHADVPDGSPHVRGAQEA